MRARQAIPSMVASLAIVLSLSAPAPVAAQTLEYAVKANYLVRFAVFVEWPSEAFASSRTPMVICVTGHSPFGGALREAAAAQTAEGRRIEVVQVTSADQLPQCHMVYVAAGTPVAWTGLMDRSRSILVVTDAATSSRRGAVHFVLNQGRVRFHIDDGAARRSGLRISSRLLGLALSVTGGTR